MAKLNHLPQDVINQIAAGEVVERPSSVVKELIDNSIDAKSSRISVRIKNGGLDLIEISDDGIGIEKENLLDIFLPHTTSKLGSIDDLLTLQTMGFRGEALSTIQSVSQVVVNSKEKDSDFAYIVDLSGKREVSKSARDNGTTISIKNLFLNIPARLKFMKSEQTEYRKILDVVIAYSLSYPSIHFILERDGKETLNLPISSPLDRIKKIVNKDYVNRMIEIRSNGAGIKISGYVGHPTDAVIKTSEQYIYVNNRPIWDNGIAKSIYLGLSRFMPHNLKVPFVIFLDVDPSLVDVNVHPRKEEVRFINPYRVYSAVEEATKQAIESNTSTNYSPQSYSNNSNSEIVKNNDLILGDNATVKYDTSSNLKEIKFGARPSNFNISKSINFSKQVLDSKSTQPQFEFANNENSNNLGVDINRENYNENIDFKKEYRSVSQIFNKYIVIEFEDTLHIIDQHAAAERITFEKLLKQVNEGNQDIQNILVPVTINISKSEYEFISENKPLFTSLGIDLTLNTENIVINSLPTYIPLNRVEDVFKNILDISQSDDEISKDVNKLKEDVYATIACHSSVRAGQKLTIPECINLYKQLGECENPYSCPHGRPAVWRLNLNEIDSHFLRTY